MYKTIGILIGGVFLGAVGVEIIRKKCPDALDNLYAKTIRMGREANDAFKKGYQSAVKPSDAVSATT